ncbi:MAG: glycosyltransferase family 4 protein [Pseudomonadota bacterium]
MRVLLINDHGRAYGGAELQMLAIQDALRDRGHQTRLFSSSAEMIQGYPLLADRTCHGRSDLAQVALQSANPLAWHALRRELAAHPPDMIHIRSFLWQLSPLILPLLKDIPVLHQAPTYKEICPNGLKLLPDGKNCAHLAGSICRETGCVSPRTYRMAQLQGWLLERWRDVLDVTTVLSRRAADRFEAAGWPNVEVLNNPADTRMAIASPSPHPTVAYAGRLSREKGVDVLIDAFTAILAEVPDAQLLIAGTGPDESALRDRAADHAQYIHFLGHLTIDEMDKALAAAWVQAVPSVWHEPFGNVTLEAMMRGTAVLGSNTGAISDVVVHGETGLIAQPGDAQDWSTCLYRLLTDKEMCIRMGHKGRERAEGEFSRDRHTERLLELYETARRRCAAKRDRPADIE